MSRGIVNTRKSFHSEDVVNSILGNFIFLFAFFFFFFFFTTFFFSLLLQLPVPRHFFRVFKLLFFSSSLFLKNSSSRYTGPVFSLFQQLPFIFLLLPPVPPRSRFIVSPPPARLLFLLTPLRYLYRYNFSSSRSSRFPFSLKILSAIPPSSRIPSLPECEQFFQLPIFVRALPKGSRSQVIRYYFPTLTRDEHNRSR